MILFWVLIVLVGGWAAPRAIDRLTVDLSLPGQAGHETREALVEIYGNGGGSPVIPVLTVSGNQTIDQRLDEITEVFAALRVRFPEFRVIDYSSTGDPFFITEDRRATFAVVFTPPSGFGSSPHRQIGEWCESLSLAPGLEVGVTGYDALAAGGEPSAGGPQSVLSETMVGAIGALLILLFVFASALAIVPLFVAGVSILSTFVIVLGLTYVTEMSFAVQILIALIGLGVAIDYSLLIITRWREERDHGLANEAAMLEAVTRAGHAVLSSALIVAVSLLVLVIVPVPILRSMGLGGLVIPLVSAGVVLTLLPALLTLEIRGREVGAHVDWPRIRNEDTASRAWRWWTSEIVRHRWIAAVSSTLVLTALSLPVFGIRVGWPATDALANSGPARDALTTLTEGGVPDGVVTPIEILLRGADGSMARETAAQLDGVSAVLRTTDPRWNMADTSVQVVVPTDETVHLADSALVSDVTESLTTVPGFVGAAGHGAEILDYVHAVFRALPWVVLALATVTVILLTYAFRSVVLAIKAVFLNGISVAATFGVMVVFWQWGYGSEAVYDIAATGAITFWVPVLVFAFLFGLSMDYEVFILTRVSEEYRRTGDTDSAVIEGVGRTGRLVTGAALILAFAFIAMATTPSADIKIFGTALAIGILLDATLVRAILLPATLSLFGEWNWWLPGWLDRLLPSPRALQRTNVGRVREPVS